MKKAPAVLIILSLTLLITACGSWQLQAPEHALDLGQVSVSGTNTAKTFAAVLKSQLSRGKIKVTEQPLESQLDITIYDEQLLQIPSIINSNGDILEVELIYRVSYTLAQAQNNQSPLQAITLRQKVLFDANLIAGNTRLIEQKNRHFTQGSRT